ncbi:uncharacterized protein LOC144611206 [Rhinoraja longicauda]
MMRREGHFTKQEHVNITELAVKGNRIDCSTLFLSLVMEKGNRPRRVMWESFVKMQNELPKLDKILKEIQKLGPDPQEYMNITSGLSELLNYPLIWKANSISLLNWPGQQSVPSQLGRPEAPIDGAANVNTAVDAEVA